MESDAKLRVTGSEPQRTVVHFSKGDGIARQ
jgi:hypothetical protein